LPKGALAMSAGSQSTQNLKNFLPGRATKARDFVSD
jgi:hypothetical protein